MQTIDYDDLISVGLDIPDYVTDDDRPRHVRDIIKRLKEKHLLQMVNFYEIGHGVIIKGNILT